MNSLKLPAEKRSGELAAEPMSDPYGYGTRMSLCDGQIDAAGAGAFKVGQRVKVVAWANVVGLSAYEDAREGKEEKSRRLELQFTDMEASAASTSDDAADKMYPPMAAAAMPPSTFL